MLSAGYTPVKVPTQNAPTLTGARSILTPTAPTSSARECVTRVMSTVQFVSSTGSRRRSPSILHVVVREELVTRQWSLSHLADTLGVRLGVVSRWLSDDEDKRVVPLPNACVQLAETLGLDVIEVFRLAGYLPMEVNHQSATHEHEAEIRTMQRLLGRMLKSIPPEGWALAYPITVAYIDGLQLILNRLDSQG